MGAASIAGRPWRSAASSRWTPTHHEKKHGAPHPRRGIAGTARLDLGGGPRHERAFGAGRGRHRLGRVHGRRGVGGFAFPAEGPTRAARAGGLFVMALIWALRVTMTPWRMLRRFTRREAA